MEEIGHHYSQLVLKALGKSIYRESTFTFFIINVISEYVMRSTAGIWLHSAKLTHSVTHSFHIKN